MIEPERHLVESTDGVTVVVHDFGGEGDPVLLAHATGFHGRYWDILAASLREHFRVFSLDLRGHGDAIVPPGTPMVWSGMAQDVVSVIDWIAERSARPLCCVGHSMGGAASLEASLLRPDRVYALWLMEPILFPSTVAPVENPMADRARRRREVFASRQEAFDRFSATKAFAGCDPDALWSYVNYGFEDLEDGTVRLKCRAETEAQVFENHFTGLFDRLAEVTAQTVVVASGDEGAPANVAPLVAEHIPGGHLQYLENNTHLAPLESPEALAADIVEFLRLSPPPA